MPFKVRCRLVAWLGDEKSFPCHFNYKLGDEFSFDGEKFIGRICPSLFRAGMPQIVETIIYSGNHHYERIIHRYIGQSGSDPKMKKYDGVGYFNRKGVPPKGAKKESSDLFDLLPSTELKKGWFFVCPDARTSACFTAEPDGLSDKGINLMFYRREMSILEKIKAKPGLNIDGVLNSFTEWERDDIYPALNTRVVDLMLEELADTDYIELRDGKAYPKISSAKK
jgi:uncharacterized repeat protein (TIGR04076 family)